MGSQCCISDLLVEVVYAGATLCLGLFLRLGELFDLYHA